MSPSLGSKGVRDRRGSWHRAVVPAPTERIEKRQADGPASGKAHPRGRGAHGHKRDGSCLLYVVGGPCIRTRRIGCSSTRCAPSGSVRRATSAALASASGRQTANLSFRSIHPGLPGRLAQPFLRGQECRPEFAVPLGGQGDREAIEHPHPDPGLTERLREDAVGPETRERPPPFDAVIVGDQRAVALAAERKLVPDLGEPCARPARQGRVGVNAGQRIADGLADREAQRTRATHPVRPTRPGGRLHLCGAPRPIDRHQGSTRARRAAGPPACSLPV